MARTYMLRVKMTADEEKRFKALADERGLSFSSYVRMILQCQYTDMIRNTEKFHRVQKAKRKLYRVSAKTNARL
jgi:hypothetical protein